MEYEQWLGILTSINADNDLNESNVIKKIGEKLEKEDPGAYKEWQDNQFDINYTFNDQCTLLHIAAENGYTKAMKVLIRKEADIHHRIDICEEDKDSYWYEMTPLHLAAKNCHTETVKALIEEGADVDAVDGYGDTPLSYAIQTHHIEIAKVLIEEGANVNTVDEYGRTPLLCAAKIHVAKKGYTEMVKALIEKGANVNTVDEYGRTPLHYAAENGHTETVKALIKKGANVDAVDKYGRTPLFYAVKEFRIKIANILMEKGANVKAVDGDGYIPLLFADIAKKGYTEVVKALIKKGANVNTVDEYGRTLLHTAAENGHTETVKALIKKGANVDAVDKYGRTPLHYAAENNCKEVVRALIEKGADVNVLESDEVTPLYYAVRNGNIDIVRALVEKGAGVNVLGPDKVTLLHYAVINGDIEIVRALIEKGADVNVLGPDNVALLHYAVTFDDAEIVEALMKKGVDPLLGNTNHRTLKRLIELIKNNSSEHPRKAEETQQREEQVDDEYELLKYSLLFRNGCPLIDNVRRDTFDNLLCTWFADVSGLTQEQKELNKKLLSILKDLSYLSDCDEDILRDFLLKNKDDDDLKCILNFTRGESKLTILHVISSMDSKLAEKYVNLLLEAGADPNIKDDRGKIPLHYASYNNIESLIKAGADPNMEDSEGRMPLHCAAGVGDKESVNVLLKHGADSSKKNKQGKTPLQVAIDNRNYHVEECFLTDDQKRLWEKLVAMVRTNGFLDKYLTDFTELKEFLSEYKNTEDLKRILNLHNHEGKSEIFLYAQAPSRLRYSHICESPHLELLYPDSVRYKEVKSLLLEAGAIDYERLDRKEHSPESGTLWDNLISNQQQKLKMFLDVVGKAQDMNQLEQVVNKAIEFGVRFNFLICPGEMMYQDTYNFTDYVIKRISELEKNPKVASDVVCKLVSKGAVLHNLSSIDVIDTLESEFKDHKTNMKKAHEEYVNNTLEFMEIVKSAATGRVKNAKMDNSTFYLEYSGDSTIDVAKITDGARDLGLTQGEIKYGRDIIKIGKSEVEIITQKGIRHYTDLADNSNIVLTFYTSLGELEVNLYPDKKDKDKIIVEVRDQEILKKLKDCREEIGKNCSLGGYRVYDAIERGYFERSGKLMRSEAMSQSNGQTKKSSWVEREEIRRATSFEETVSRCT